MIVVVVLVASKAFEESVAYPISGEGQRLQRAVKEPNNDPSTYLVTDYLKRPLRIDSNGFVVHKESNPEGTLHGKTYMCM